MFKRTKAFTSDKENSVGSGEGSQGNKLSYPNEHFV